MDSVLSRSMNMNLEDRDGQNLVEFSGFSTPATTTLKSWRGSEEEKEFVIADEPAVM